MSVTVIRTFDEFVAQSIAHPKTKFKFAFESGQEVIYAYTGLGKLKGFSVRDAVRKGSTEDNNYQVTKLLHKWLKEANDRDWDSFGSGSASIRGKHAQEKFNPSFLNQIKTSYVHHDQAVQEVLEDPELTEKVAFQLRTIRKYEKFLTAFRLGANQDTVWSQITKDADNNSISSVAEVNSRRSALKVFADDIDEESFEVAQEAMETSRKGHAPSRNEKFLPKELRAAIVDPLENVDVIAEQPLDTTSNIVESARLMSVLLSYKRDNWSKTGAKDTSIPNAVAFQAQRLYEAKHKEILFQHGQYIPEGFHVVKRESHGEFALFLEPIALRHDVYAPEFLEAAHRWETLQVTLGDRLTQVSSYLRNNRKDGHALTLEQKVDLKAERKQIQEFLQGSAYTLYDNGQLIAVAKRALQEAEESTAREVEEINKIHRFINETVPRFAGGKANAIAGLEYAQAIVEHNQQEIANANSTAESLAMAFEIKKHQALASRFEEIIASYKEPTEGRLSPTAPPLEEVAQPKARVPEPLYSAQDWGKQMYTQFLQKNPKPSVGRIAAELRNVQSEIKASLHTKGSHTREYHSLHVYKFELQQAYDEVRKTFTAKEVADYVNHYLSQLSGEGPDAYQAVYAESLSKLDELEMSRMQLAEDDVTPEARQILLRIAQHKALQNALLAEIRELTSLDVIAEEQTREIEAQKEYQFGKDPNPIARN